jgi:hypothetical protein
MVFETSGRWDNSGSTDGSKFRNEKRYLYERKIRYYFYRAFSVLSGVGL